MVRGANADIPQASLRFGPIATIFFPSNWPMPINGTRFQGVGHMMMFGTNALEVFDGILKWSEPNIPNPIVEDARPNGRKPGKGPKS